MPGHQKKGKPGEVDPDPKPYLVVTLEMKREFQNKPYDPKKSPLLFLLIGSIHSHPRLCCSSQSYTIDYGALYNHLERILIDLGYYLMELLSS